MTPASKKKKPTASPVRKPLSPRGRGSIPDPGDEGKLQLLFATNMVKVRKARGVSQEQLADLADLHRTYVSSTERNLRNISLRSVQRIAAALQVDPRVLMEPALTERQLIALGVKPFAPPLGPVRRRVRAV